MSATTTWKTSEQELIMRFRQGDKSAFDQLYDHYAPLLYGMLCVLTGDKKKAAETLQQTFLSLWQTRSSLTADKGSLLGVLASIARRCAGPGLPQNGESVEIISPSEIRPSPDFVHNHGPEPPGTSPGITDSAIQDKVLQMMYIGGMPPQDIAAYLNITPGAVMEMIRGAINRLKVRDHA